MRYTYPVIYILNIKISYFNIYLISIKMEYHKGYKIRDLPKKFMKEREYYRYTLEQFKDWLNKEVTEVDWSDINIWGNLDHFTSLPFEDIRIFDYLFQLKTDPFYLYISCMEKIIHLEKMPQDTTTIVFIKKYKDIASICSKYMTKELKEHASYIIKNPKDV